MDDRHTEQNTKISCPFKNDHENYLFYLFFVQIRKIYFLPALTKIGPKDPQVTFHLHPPPLPLKKKKKRKKGEQKKMKNRALSAIPPYLLLEPPLHLPQDQPIFCLLWIGREDEREPSKPRFFEQDI